MINKVLKNLKKLEKKSGKASTAPNSSYPISKLKGNKGFHAKENSQLGAERQRSIGNRNNKPAR